MPKRGDMCSKWLYTKGIEELNHLMANVEGALTLQERICALAALGEKAMEALPDYMARVAYENRQGDGESLGVPNFGRRG